MDTVFGVSYDGGGELVWWLTLLLGRDSWFHTSMMICDLWKYNVKVLKILNIVAPTIYYRTLGRIKSLSSGWYFEDYFRCLSLLMFVGHKSMSDIFCGGRAKTGGRAQNLM